MTGLQNLIDMCVQYSMKWRFKFNPVKTKCFISGKHRFNNEPKWLIGENVIEVTNELDILGSTFSEDGKGRAHVERRINSCRRNYYGLGEVGMVYPGLDTNTKRYLWNTMFYLLYFMEQNVSIFVVHL